VYTVGSRPTPTDYIRPAKARLMCKQPQYTKKAQTPETGTQRRIPNGFGKMPNVDTANHNINEPPSIRFPPKRIRPTNWTGVARVRVNKKSCVGFSLSRLGLGSEISGKLFGTHGNSGLCPSLCFLLLRFIFLTVSNLQGTQCDITQFAPFPTTAATPPILLPRATPCPLTCIINGGSFAGA
jgi:hypothetical protein